jgi:hypothetical protein
MASTMRTVILECTEGTANKTYVMTIERQSGGRGFVYSAFWGKKDGGRPLATYKCVRAVARQRRLRQRGARAQGSAACCSAPRARVGF